jgi:hypothetical protein
VIGKPFIKAARNGVNVVVAFLTFSGRSRRHLVVGSVSQQFV